MTSNLLKFLYFPITLFLFFSPHGNTAISIRVMVIYYMSSWSLTECRATMVFNLLELIGKCRAVGPKLVALLFSTPNLVLVSTNMSQPASFH